MDRHCLAILGEMISRVVAAARIGGERGRNSGCFPRFTFRETARERGASPGRPPMAPASARLPLFSRRSGRCARPVRPPRRSWKSPSRRSPSRFYAPVRRRCAIPSRAASSGRERSSGSTTFTLPRGRRRAPPGDFPRADSHLRQSQRMPLSEWFHVRLPALRYQRNRAKAH